jgi:hypothetical protein
VKRTHLLIASIVLGVLLSGLSIRSVYAQNGDSLYKRLGGYDALAKVTDDFIARLATDKTLADSLLEPATIRR